MNCDKNVKQLDELGRQRRVMEWEAGRVPGVTLAEGPGLPAGGLPEAPGSRRTARLCCWGREVGERQDPRKGRWGEPAAAWGTRPREAGVSGPSRSLLIPRGTLHAEAAGGPGGRP